VELDIFHVLLAPSYHSGIVQCYPSIGYSTLTILPFLHLYNCLICASHSSLNSLSIVSYHSNEEIVGIDF
jgi:hypothetical protein